MEPRPSPGPRGVTRQAGRPFLVNLGQLALFVSYQYPTKHAWGKRKQTPRRPKIAWLCDLTLGV
jgi:hypothetical protein